MVEKLNKQIMGETVTNINLIFASILRHYMRVLTPFLSWKIVTVS